MKIGYVIALTLGVGSWQDTPPPRHCRLIKNRIICQEQISALQWRWADFKTQNHQISLNQGVVHARVWRRKYNRNFLSFFLQF